MATIANELIDIKGNKKKFGSHLAMEFQNRSRDQCKLALLVDFLDTIKLIQGAQKKLGSIVQPRINLQIIFAKFLERHLFQQL